ncbi:NlpC/P60 family protein [Streptomyces sp. NPDC048604]|uniref:C40 family peptidase n=1 Tax=Streptomyces sp. NPDC048604 TaxID=3365578 RepID=UPI00371122D4
MSGKLLRTVCTGMLAAATALAPTPAATADDPADPAPAGVTGTSATGEDDEDGTETPVLPGDVPEEASEGASEETPDDGVDPAEDESAGTDPAGDPNLDEPSDALDDLGLPGTGDASELPDPLDPSLSPGAPSSLSQLLTRLRTLYQEAGAATETFNATAEELKVRTAETKAVTARLTAARTALARSRDDAGRLAREQYQGSSEFSSYLRVLLARNPQQALDQGHLMERAARGRAATIARLAGGEKQADALATASRKALDRQQVLTARQKKARDTVETKLKEVQRLLAGLSPQELTALSELERRGTAGAQRELLGSGVLDGPRTPSREGGEALRFAVAQIGKPYVWGAEGPESYDCSGLTQQAWASAGREVPRTSQEQWRTLPKVPLRELRPGDLVVYFPGAMHVAIYLGEGLVVQAPRPGGKVKVSPIAANPLLGAVRPDPSGAALASYTPPELPEGATDGADEGFDRE